MRHTATALQHTATVLQNAALQHTATALRHAAVCCSAVAVCCILLLGDVRCVAVRGSAVAVHGSVLHSVVL